MVCVIIPSMSSSEISTEALSSDSADFELVTASQWGEEWTARDTASVRLQLLGRVLCCRNKPRIRWIRSKGAILVLLWNCLALSYYGSLTPTLALAAELKLSSGGTYLILLLVQALSEMLLYPLAGWIADVYFGRYRVIKASLWLMWAGVVLFGLHLCIKLLLSSHHEWIEVALKTVLFSVALLAMEAGIAGFNANIIPFGIDQLPTASGEQLSGFITWFVLTYCVKIGVFPYLFSCPWGESHYLSLLMPVLFQAVLLSAALTLNSFCQDWLVMEPQTSNPFKLVARVLRYAWKNKQPQFRSAFTYHDSTKPSRIEYGKEIFGGPFTTEQVEDVKTFLRIVTALLPIGGTFAFGILLGSTVTLFALHIDSHNIPCYGYNATSVYLMLFIVVFAVPIYEFLVHPIVHNYIPTMLTRFGIGLILYILSCVAFLTIDLVAHKEAGNTNYSCLYNENTQGETGLQFNLWWTILPSGLVGFGIFFNLTASYEFVFSQSPYSMKGLFMGAIYATMGVFLLLELPLLVPFYLGYVDNLTAVPSCGSVYLLVLLALSIAWFIVYVFVARCYHKRQRGETERQQDYPEEYYSKYLGSRHA